MQRVGGVRALGSSSGSSSSNNNAVVNRDGVLMRKGPWTAEEDEILLDYVRKHGPRDWSSIRSKGLLPRTGKSCRLRWVNKLKPHLKTGCKFSPEEERIVIELQARFGNKWARIATYLPGRTDNDVKNFWSTRRKRLARILLQTPMPSKSSTNQGEAPVGNGEVASLGLIPFEEESRSGLQELGLVNPHYITVALFEPPLDWELPQIEHLSIPALDFPLVFESPELRDKSLQDKFAWQDNLFGVAVGRNVVKTEAHSGTPHSFFDDFPIDMFDCLENPPPPTSSASW